MDEIGSAPRFDLSEISPADTRSDIRAVTRLRRVAEATDTALTSRPAHSTSTLDGSALLR